MKTKGSTVLWMSRVAGKMKLRIALLLVVETLLGISGVFNTLAMRELINTAVAGNRPGFLTAAFFLWGWPRSSSRPGRSAALLRNLPRAV